MLAAQLRASLACAADVVLSELDDCNQAKARFEALNSTGKVMTLKRNTIANIAMPTQNKAGKVLMRKSPISMTIIDSLDEMLTAGTKAVRSLKGA